MRSLDMLTAVVLVTALAACGGEDTERTLDATGDTAAVPGARDTARQPAVAGPVPVVLTEWAIEMPRDTLRAGPVTFNVTNRGSVRHAFEVEGGGQEWETEEIGPGEETQLRADLPAGTYRVYCPVVGDQGEHAELGMTGTLVVR